MSEFKFACSVCGQHITADSSASGGQLECPTCYQKIIIPQAPTSADSKYILSASQVAKPRPAQSEILSGANSDRAYARRSSLPLAGAGLILLCAAGAAAFVFRDQIFKLGRPGAETGKAASDKKKSGAPAEVYAIPTNINWSLDLANAILPQSTASGSVHGSGFLCEKATLQGGTLTLRQGKNWPPDLGVTVQLFAQQGEELSGKSVQIGPEQTPPLPKIVLRWKDEQHQPMARNFASGYALKVVFGEAANGRMPGRLYISLPDESKSFVAGTFDAEIRKAPPPKLPKPKKPKG